MSLSPSKSSPSKISLANLDLLGRSCCYGDGENEGGGDAPSRAYPDVSLDDGRPHLPSDDGVPRRSSPISSFLRKSVLRCVATALMVSHLGNNPQLGRRAHLFC